MSGHAVFVGGEQGGTDGKNRCRMGTVCGKRQDQNQDPGGKNGKEGPPVPGLEGILPLLRLHPSGGNAQKTQNIFYKL